MVPTARRVGLSAGWRRQFRYVNPGEESRGWCLLWALARCGGSSFTPCRGRSFLRRKAEAGRLTAIIHGAAEQERRLRQKPYCTCLAAWALTKLRAPLSVSHSATAVTWLVARRCTDDPVIF